MNEGRDQCTQDTAGAGMGLLDVARKLRRRTFLSETQDSKGGHAQLTGMYLSGTMPQTITPVRKDCPGVEYAYTPDLCRTLKGMLNS